MPTIDPSRPTRREGAKDLNGLMGVVKELLGADQCFLLAFCLFKSSFPLVEVAGGLGFRGWFFWGLRKLSSAAGRFGRLSVPAKRQCPRLGLDVNGRWFQTYILVTESCLTEGRGRRAFIQSLEVFAFPRQA